MVANKYQQPERLKESDIVENRPVLGSFFSAMAQDAKLQQFLLNGNRASIVAARLGGRQLTGGTTVFKDESRIELPAGATANGVGAAGIQFNTNGTGLANWGLWCWGGDGWVIPAPLVAKYYDYFCSFNLKFRRNATGTALFASAGFAGNPTTFNVSGAPHQTGDTFFDAVPFTPPYLIGPVSPAAYFYFEWATGSPFNLMCRLVGHKLDGGGGAYTRYDPSFDLELISTTESAQQEVAVGIFNSPVTRYIDFYHKAVLKYRVFENDTGIGSYPLYRAGGTDEKWGFGPFYALRGGGNALNTVSIFGAPLTYAEL